VVTQGENDDGGTYRHVEVVIHVPVGTEAPSEDDVWAYYAKTGVTEATVSSPSLWGFVATERRIYEFTFADP
jgi:hypothetical protein